MKNEKGEYLGLADLSDSKGKRMSLEDLKAGAKKSTPTTAQPPVVANELPEKYKGKSWDELYRLDELELVRTNYPAHYEKLRVERFNPKN